MLKHINPAWQEPGEWHYTNLPTIYKLFNDPVSLAEWRQLGYTHKLFTGEIYDMNNPEPPWMKSVRTALPWKYFSWSIHFMMPGRVIPEHGDTYVTFKRVHNLEDTVNIHRALIFMDDWQSGHIFEVNKAPVLNYKAGDYVVWKNDTLHLAANVGKTHRYSLQITGVIE